MLGRVAGVLHQFGWGRTVVCSTRSLAYVPGPEERPQDGLAKCTWLLGAKPNCGRASNEAVYAEQPRHHVSTITTSDAAAYSASGVDFLNQAVGINAERELVTRLAALWRISPHVLGDTVSALSDLLKPCGRDTAPHALWVLIRCPSMRYWSEQQLRSSYRQLLGVTRGAQLSQADTTAAVYRHPWMLNAAAATAVVRRSPRGAHIMVPGPEGCVSALVEVCQLQPLPVAARKKLMATLLVQAQAFSTPVSSNSSTSPPYISPTWVSMAVKAYLLVAETLQSLAIGRSTAQARDAALRLLPQQVQQLLQMKWPETIDDRLSLTKEYPVNDAEPDIPGR